MKIFKSPSYDELPKQEELGRFFSGMGWPEVLLFAIFLVPMVVLPLIPLLAGTFAIIVKLITQ